MAELTRLQMAERVKWLASKYGAACELSRIGDIEPAWQAFVAAIDALATVEAGSEWMPIDSAPKDGTHILAMIPDSDTCHVICWVDSSKGIRVGCGVYGWHVAWDGYPLAGYSTPTRWMHQPAITADPAEGGGARGAV